MAENCVLGSSRRQWNSALMTQFPDGALGMQGKGRDVVKT